MAINYLRMVSWHENTADAASVRTRFMVMLVNVVISPSVAEF